MFETLLVNYLCLNPNAISYSVHVSQPLLHRVCVKGICTDMLGQVTLANFHLKYWPFLSVWWRKGVWVEVIIFHSNKMENTYKQWVSVRWGTKDETKGYSSHQIFIKLSAKHLLFAATGENKIKQICLNKMQINSFGADFFFFFFF